MHLEEGLLEALLDGELDAVTAANARQHIAECDQCRGRFEELRGNEQWLEGVLQALDHPAPRIPLATIVARANAWRQPLRWAAAIALFLIAAGAAYALPGSPVRRWIDRLVGQYRSEEKSRTSDVAGIALPPGEHFSIVFTAPRAPGALTIALTDGPTVDVRRRGGAGTFTAEIERLRIETSGAATDFDIAIPRLAPWVEVLVGGQRIFLKDGPRIITKARADAEGRYVF